MCNFRRAPRCRLLDSIMILSRDEDEKCHTTVKNGFQYWILIGSFAPKIGLFSRYQSRKWHDREFICTFLTDLIPFSVKADWQVQLWWNFIRFQPSFISKCPISASCDPNSPILLRFSFKSVRFTLILPVWQSLQYYLLTGLVISGYKTVPKIEHIELDSPNSTCNRTRNHMFLGV